MCKTILDILILVLKYAPDTGYFHWKVDVARSVPAGSIAGTLSSQNRIRIAYNGKTYYAHRLAWLFTHGKWPDGVVDHIDGDPSNNKIDNLRDVSVVVNGQNRKGSQNNNHTGLLGVGWHKQAGKFQSRIKIGNKLIWLGLFLTAEEAHTAYLKAKRKYHEGCTI
jgi:hypothetical protein